MVRKIESSDNPIFKLAGRLGSSHGIKKENKFLLSGLKIIKELSVSDRGSLIETILINEEAEEDTYLGFLKAIDPKKFFVLNRALFKQLDAINTGDVLAICNFPEIPELDPATAVNGLEVCLSLADPGNLGAAIRTCTAFNVQKIILTKECAHPYLPKTVKASSGTAIHAPIVWGPAISEIQKNENLVVIDQGGENIFEYQFPKNVRLVLGREGEGIPPHLSTVKKVSIAINPKVESLNAMVALGIILASANRSML